METKAPPRITPNEIILKRVFATLNHQIRRQEIALVITIRANRPMNESLANSPKLTPELYVRTKLK